MFQVNTSIPNLTLRQISLFNLDARYEDYKEEFYKKATKKYTLKWINIAERIYQWLKKQI